MTEYKDQSLKAACDVITKFLDKKYRGLIYFVGGCCRDYILSKNVNSSIKDFDLLSFCNPRELIELMKKAGANITNEVVFKKYQTYRFTLEGFDFEISRARSETYNKESRKPEVVWATTLEEDLLRRDFTINCVTLCPFERTFLHSFSSDKDLAFKILQTPNDPEQTFKDDPLRILRAVRFSVKYNLTIQTDTYYSMKFCIPYLDKVSKERIKEELWKMSQNKDFYKALMILDDIGLLSILFPTVSLLKKLKQGGAHEFDVFKHTIEAVKHADSFDPIVKWAAFFHDFGKAYTRKKTQNKYTFYRHEELSAKLAFRYLTDLTFFEIRDSVTALVKHHMVLLNPKSRTEKHIRKLVLRLGNNFNKLIHLMESDIKAKTSKATCEDLFPLIELGVKALSKAESKEFDSPLDGFEIMQALNLSPGPIIKEVKNHLIDLVLSDKLVFDDKESATQEALKFVNNKESI